ncbi:MAG TPA: NAD(P)H-dependent glycerol-3-phosphate dehydrogenase [Opitutaceae bacterium]|jgi:glycerol-3-phosphate dehydrogenase (NAD(P)+)|nr:NAD(P)H-dependent glycerol-3-phosphate dehydrogenase [Opitutaceae bacterium]
MKFCVVGAGAWGTAFALHLDRGARGVALVPRRAEQAAAIAASRENREYLPGLQLPKGILVTADLAEGLSGADVVLLACPAQTLRQTSANIRGVTAAGSAQKIVISLAKGLELGSHMRPSQTISEELPGILVGALSGPTNAAEVAKGLPAAMVLAAKGDEALIHDVQSAISGPTLRVYTTDDLAGVEFGASLKNVYAIAAGCCEGLGLGDNAKAALLTRAVAEMVKVGGSLGARRETFYGLSGFGDLVATCHGPWSRNREFGQRIGEGRAISELLTGRKTVVEGYETTRSFAGLCVEKGIDAPILAETNAILFKGRRPADAISALMMRELKRETAPALAPA